MDYNSIVFREFTHESLQRIERYRREQEQDVTTDGTEKQKQIEDNHQNHRYIKNSSDNEPMKPQQVPNKELAVGAKLPRILQNKISPELIGKPIEEIDPFYRTEYV